MGESDQIFQHKETANTTADMRIVLSLNHQTGPLHSLLLLAVDGKLHLGFPGAELSLQLPPDLGDQLEISGGAQPDLHPVHLPADSHLHA